MLTSLNKMIGWTVTASDGPIGHITAAFFNDQTWVIRYLVVDTGVWLAKREVLVSPFSINNMSIADGNVDVSLTREQVRTSPDIDTHKPISRQHEIAHQKHFTYPSFWGARGVLLGEPYSMTPALSSPATDPTPFEVGACNERTSTDAHLRSSVSVTGYSIIGTDADIGQTSTGHTSIGHVKDFIFDEQLWAIKYLVVDTGGCLTGGRSVLLDICFVKSIAWETSSLRVSLTRGEVDAGPEYDESQPVDHSSGKSFASNHTSSNKRSDYWDV